MQYESYPRVPKLRAKRIVSTYYEVHKLIDDYAILFEKYLTEIAAHIMYNFIKKNWYDAYDSEENYDRTFEFLNAILILQSGKGYSVGVDGRKMKTRQEGEDGKFNQHIDFDGDSQIQMLSTFIDSKGIFIPNGEGDNITMVKVRDPIHYIRETEKIINKNIEKYRREFNLANNIKN